jgi:hypothetical protein
MLLEIAKLPTAENSVIHLHETDNVAIARVPLSAGTTLKVDGQTVVAQEPIPAGHKIALATISQGAVVRRYGQIIGRARQTIEPGHHVHTHNLAFEELHFNYEFPTGETPLPARRAAPTFLGYAREDGSSGDAQLHRGGGGQQLRCAHGGTDRARVMRWRIAAGKCRRRGGVSAWRRLRAHAIGPDTEQLTEDAGRSAGSS